MIDIKKEVVTELKKSNLPVYYELFIDNTPTIPCVTYIEDDNTSYAEGDSIGYSEIVYRVKVWAKDIKTVSEKTIIIDNLMTNMGFKRKNSIELSNNGIVQKITKYSAYALEKKE